MTHHHLKKIKHVHIHRYLTFLSEENFVELNYKAKSIFSGIFLSRYDNYFMSKKYLEEIIDIEGAFIHDFYPFNLLLLQRIYIYTENYKILNGLFYKHVNKINKIKIKGMLFYNFVLSLEVKNKEEEAIKNYKIALKYFKNKNLRDLCNNNIGVCLCKLKKYEESNKIYFELLNSSTKNIDKSRYYSNLLINYIGLNYKISVKNIVYKLDRLLFELNKLNKIKYQSYMCLGIFIFK